MSTPAEQIPGSIPTGKAHRHEDPAPDLSSIERAEEQTAALMAEFAVEDALDPVREPSPPSVAGSQPPASAPATPPAVVVPPVETPPTVPAVAPPVEVPPVVPTPAVAPAAPPTSSAQPPAVGETPPATPTAPAVQAPKLMTQEDIDKWMSESTSTLAEKFYKLEEGDISEFETNPGEFLSKQFARAHMTMLTSVTQAVLHTLPNIMRAVNQQQADFEEGERMFWNAWPELAKQKETVGGDALRLAMDYRMRNPAATPDMLIRDVGAMVHMQHRIPLPGVGAGAPPATSTPAPYVPPVGGGVITPAPSQPATQWDRLASEFAEEEI